MSLFVDTSVWSLALRRDSPPEGSEVRRLREALGGGEHIRFKPRPLAGTDAPLLSAFGLGLFVGVFWLGPLTPCPTGMREMTRAPCRAKRDGLGSWQKPSLIWARARAAPDVREKPYPFSWIPQYF